MFIVIEGPDGCGKSSHAAKLTERLKAKFFKFPNKDSVSGKLIYEHLEHKWNSVFRQDGKDVLDEHVLNALVFQSLQSLNRLELANDIIKADISGNVVIDRYWPSGYAYGKADGLDGDYLIKVHEILPQPDLFILLDIDIKDSVERRPDRRDRYEANIPFMEKVMANYRELWSRNLFPSKWEVIDARGTPEQTAQRIEGAVVRLRNELDPREP